jgi:hypothetical protein
MAFLLGTRRTPSALTRNRYSSMTGISGDEFANRPGFLRLTSALKLQPVFQALVTV